jgi:hypothetical protein
MATHNIPARVHKTWARLKTEAETYGKTTTAYEYTIFTNFYILLIIITT